MNNCPLVSVIIITYNSQFHFLEKAVSSVVIDQTYSNIELIIVDDNSTNGTRQKLIELQDKFNFKLILLQKNSGSAARPFNEGLKIANGKYVAICAHDDYYMPEKIAVQVAFHERHPDFMMSYSKTYIVIQDENDLQVAKTTKCHSGKIFRDIFLQRYYVPALTAMMRREVFDAVGYYDEKLLIEDWDMWLKIANQFEIGFIDEYLACYRMHDSNSSKVYSKRMVQDRKTIMAKWSSKPEYRAAMAINRLIDGESIKESYVALVHDAWIALIYLRQPYRVLRLFLSNIKRKYFYKLATN